MNCVSGHALLFKKELTQHIFPFPSQVPHDWWIAFIASIYGGIVYFNEALIKYRIHDDNALVLNKNRKSKENKITNRQVRIREFYNKCPDNNKAKEVLFELNNVYQNISLANKFNKIALFYKYREDLFIINEEENSGMIQLTMGNFDRPVSKYLLIKEGNISYYQGNPLPTSSNILAHKKLKEILSI